MCRFLVTVSVWEWGKGDVTGGEGGGQTCGGDGKRPGDAGEFASGNEGWVCDEADVDFAWLEKAADVLSKLVRQITLQQSIVGKVLLPSPQSNTPPPQPS